MRSHRPRSGWRTAEEHPARAGPAGPARSRACAGGPGGAGCRGAARESPAPRRRRPPCTRGVVGELGPQPEPVGVGRIDENRDLRAGVVVVDHGHGVPAAVGHLEHELTVIGHARHDGRLFDRTSEMRFLALALQVHQTEGGRAHEHQTGREEEPAGETGRPRAAGTCTCCRGSPAARDRCRRRLVKIQISRTAHRPPYTVQPIRAPRRHRRTGGRGRGTPGRRPRQRSAATTAGRGTRRGRSSTVRRSGPGRRPWDR